jgi:dipeptidyl-peptidase III
VKHYLASALLMSGATMQSSQQSLSVAPSTVTQAHEMVLVFNQELVEHFNALTPQERIFIYYLHRASLPGNIIAADQSHRDTPKILALLEFVFEHKDTLLKQENSFDVQQFLKDVETFLIYLWSNHSPYFCREHSDEKRTPERLHLTELTQENLISALESLQYSNAQKEVESIAKSLFDTAYESTLTVPDSISKGAVNFYAHDFTDEDFKKIDPKGQSALNAYFYIATKDGQRVPRYQLYSVNGKYAKELSVMVHWLEKAYKHAQKYPQQFDAHLTQSLTYLIDYFKTGDEELFKKHSIEWLQSNSRIDYVFGFIETYHDPKSYRALFQSDVTIKSVDINKLNEMLPAIERALPINKAYQRHIVDGQQGAMPNASINVKAFSAGSLGPFNLTLAYCLPNYNEIRSEHGSKQIIYHAEKSLGEKINSDVSYRLFNAKEYFDWFAKHDLDYQLMRDIFMLEVILHETLGHGSGRLTSHTFKEGDELEVEGKMYSIGDTIPVTSSNIQPLLLGYDQTLEELRAEIMALLASIVCYDEFAQVGMLKDWPEKVGKDKIIELSVISMARSGLRRLISQSEHAKEVSGDHARANTTILRYLLASGAIEIINEEVSIDEKAHTVLDVKLLDRDKAIATIEELANLVQEIKSTGDGQRAKWLIDTYGKVLDPKQLKIMQENMKAVVGDAKMSATIYPIYTPLYNEHDEFVDIQSEWPSSFTEACQIYKKLALSYER